MRNFVARHVLVAGIGLAAVTLGSGCTGNHQEPTTSATSALRGSAHALPLHSAPLPTAAAIKLSQKAPCAESRVATNLVSQQRISALRVAVVVRCLYTAGGHELIRQIATSSIRPLLASLLKVNRPTPTDATCAAVGYAPLPILLADRSGNFLHPAWPKIRCGGEPTDVAQALDTMTWRNVS